MGKRILVVSANGNLGMLWPLFIYISSFCILLIVGAIYLQVNCYWHSGGKLKFVSACTETAIVIPLYLFSFVIGGLVIERGEWFLKSGFGVENTKPFGSVINLGIFILCCYLQSSLYVDMFEKVGGRAIAYWKVGLIGCGQFILLVFVLYLEFRFLFFCLYKFGILT